MTKPYTITVTDNGDTEDISLTVTLIKGSSAQLISSAAAQHGYQNQIQEVDENENPVFNEDGTPSMIDNPVSDLDHFAEAMVNFAKESAKAHLIKLANEQAAASTEQKFNSLLS